MKNKREKNIFKNFKDKIFGEKNKKSTTIDKIKEKIFRNNKKNQSKKNNIKTDNGIYILISTIIVCITVLTFPNNKETNNLASNNPNTTFIENTGENKPIENINNDISPSQIEEATDDESADKSLNKLEETIDTENAENNDIVVNEPIIVDTSYQISLAEIPEFSNMPYVEINNNIPFFDSSELTNEAYEKYSDLDELGRAGVAIACIKKGMDDTPRSKISNVTPTGWQNTKYNGIDGNNLYNRCHLIANQLTGENDNEKNLITGTRYMNTQGMARFEDKVAKYIDATNNHVLYRVTPMFENDDLLAKGVLIEAQSIEDNGSSILFNVFCYNVQPGIEIDYKNGNNKKIEEKAISDNIDKTATKELIISEPEEKTSKSYNTVSYTPTKMSDNNESNSQT